MSDTKKVVKIKENELVDLIDNLVNEALVVKKKEWLAEQAKAGDKSAILETKFNELEAKFTKLTEGKTEVKAEVKAEVKK